MFANVIALLISLPLGLTLSDAAQTPVAGQTTQAQSLQEEMSQLRQLIEGREARISRLEAEKSAPVPKPASTTGKAAPARKDTSKLSTDDRDAPGLLIQLRATAKTEERKKDEQPLTERKKILLDRLEQIEKRLAEVESRLADITSVDKCQRAGALTASELQPAVSTASNATTAAPISDVGENSQAPAKHGGIGISPRFIANSIPRWKNKKEPFAFADSNWLTGAFRTMVEAPSQSGYKEADNEARIFKVDKTDRVNDLDNAQSKKTGQSDKTNKGMAPASAGKAPPRRANPAPLDGVFPSSEYIGPSPLIGVPDTDPVYPLTEALWRLSPALKESRIKVYGWVNPGISVSTSDEYNIPESYAIVPNKPQLDQGILRFERLPDTVQTDHVDWGFRLTGLYGIDYRWTTSQGWLSGQLLARNQLYGADPVEVYGLIYVPKVAKGMVIKFGRYISPPDIEAQLAPDNYLFTHSLMFTYDCYTQTGVNAAVKLNDSWTILGGIHAGCDVAPWNRASHPTGQFIARWVSKSNNDSIYGGINSINNGHFKDFHDNLQQSNITWSHRFNEKGTFVTMTEVYYIYQSHALVGGTVNFGPPRSWFRLTGPGAPIQGNAPAIGVVNYTAIKISKRNFITLRPIDYLVDVKGERTGFATTLSSWTVGLTHRFGDQIMIRPELRYEHAFSARPWDNGRRNKQFMFAMDAIIRF